MKMLRISKTSGHCDRMIAVQSIIPNENGFDIVYKDGGTGFVFDSGEYYWMPRLQVTVDCEPNAGTLSWATERLAEELNLHFNAPINRQYNRAPSYEYQEWEYMDIETVFLMVTNKGLSWAKRTAEGYELGALMSDEDYEQNR